MMVLQNRTFRHLYLAQIVALIGTGLATVALGLLAFDLAGERAGTVLGTALAIKMIAYVTIAPIASAVLQGIPRRSLLVSLDVVRAGVALLLPFVTEIWHVYVLIFVLQSASAAFTPTFQATIPDILPDESQYTRALSLSRVAYDLESVISPLLAAGLLLVMSFHTLFVGTSIGFLFSAGLVLSVVLPLPIHSNVRSLRERLISGSKVFFATPRLRGLFAVYIAVSMAGAMVIVNTVVFVQGKFSLSQSDTAIALGVFGAGSLGAALVLPSLLDKVSDRTPMLAGALIISLATLLTSQVNSYPLLLAVWGVIGFGYSLAQTPSGRLLRRSSSEENRTALFAANFSISHLSWLIAYPLAGWAGYEIGLSGTALVLGSVGVLAVIGAAVLWPRHDPQVIHHHHPELSANHPHVLTSQGEHAHEYRIDDLHQAWPSR